MIKSNWKQNIHGFTRGGRYPCHRKTSSWNSWVSLTSVSRFLTAPWGCGECTSLNSLQLLVFSRACYMQLGSGEVPSAITLPRTHKPYWFTLKWQSHNMPKAAVSSCSSLWLFNRRGGTTRSFILIKKDAWCDTFLSHREENNIFPWEPFAQYFHGLWPPCRQNYLYLAERNFIHCWILQRKHLYSFLK